MKPTAYGRSAFVMAPLSVVEHRHLSAMARLVWIRLKAHQNRGSGKCNPTHTTIARELGASVHKIKRAVRELRCGGLLSAANKHGRGNWYGFAQAWVETTKESVACQCTGAPSAGANLHPLPVQECTVGAPASLYELDVLNQRKEPPAAAVSACEGSAPERPTRAAAAAVPPQESFDFETPLASPPAAAPAPAPVVEVLPAVAPAVDVVALAQDMAKKLIAVHPQPGLPQRVAPRIEKILREAPEPLVVAEQIWNNHRVWRDYWARLEAGKFIPHLWRWLDEKEWEEAPVIRKPAQKATLAERAIALMRERAARDAGRKAC